jgi:hypothetical protein
MASYKSSLLICCALSVLLSFSCKKPDNQADQIENRISLLLAKMTLDDKIGQMT